MPSRLSSTHLPRTTGDVRLAADVTVRMLPWPSSPRRGSFAGERHAADAAAANARHPVVPRQALVHKREVGVEQIDDRRSSRTMVRKSSSVSCWNDARRFSSKSGESGLTFLNSRRQQPLAGEVVDQRVGARIGEHAPHLPLEHGRVFQLPRRRASRSAHRRGCCSRGRTTAATPVRDR